MATYHEISTKTINIAASGCTNQLVCYTGLKDKSDNKFENKINESHTIKLDLVSGTWLDVTLGDCDSNTAYPIYITVSNNTDTTNSRSAKIKFKYGSNVSNELTVTQDKATTIPTPPPVEDSYYYFKIDYMSYGFSQPNIYFVRDSTLYALNNSIQTQLNNKVLGKAEFESGRKWKICGWESDGVIFGAYLGSVSNPKIQILSYSGSTFSTVETTVEGTTAIIAYDSNTLKWIRLYPDAQPCVNTEDDGRGSIAFEPMGGAF